MIGLVFKTVVWVINGLSTFVKGEF